MRFLNYPRKDLILTNTQTDLNKKILVFLIIILKDKLKF